jgi:hypothetical protein
VPGAAVGAAPGAAVGAAPGAAINAYAGGPIAASPRPPRPQIEIVDDPSLSLPIAARRPWGLIFVVLVIDAGLAVAGILLLAQGLR